MTEHRAHDEIPDERVSQLYRAHATERTSSSLDRRILERARRSPSHSRIWAPALGVAATTVLGVSLVLGLRGPLPDAGGSGETAIAPAAADADRAAGSPAVTAPESRSFRTEGEAAATELGSGSGRASEALGRAAESAATDCADHRDDEARWKRCIEALESSGRHETAARERSLAGAPQPDTPHHPD